MSFNYNNPNQQSFYNAANNVVAQPPMHFQQQNIQPLFPQPQGNVYNINSTLEVANVPVGAGVSVALCMNEGCMYIKTMQNGNPMFWAYKITPYDTDKTNPDENTLEEKSLNNQAEQYNTRFEKLEQQVNEIQNSLRKNKGEWSV